MSETAYVTEERLKEVLNEALTPIYQLLGKHDKKLDLLPEIVGRLDEHDRRLDRVEQRLDSIEQRLDSIEQRLDSIEQRLDGIDAALAAIMNHLTNGDES